MFNSQRGKFIVFEGLDGSGKGTQIDLLARNLRNSGISVAVTAEPTDSAVGGLIRDALSGNHPRTPYELAALFLADRTAHNCDPVKGIEKALSEGKYVICDRYYYSSFAYQGIDTGLDWVMKMNLGCEKILKPDICIYLDLDPETCMDRIERSRAFREIYENTEKLTRIRNRFFEVFAKLGDTHNIRTIDASGDPEDIEKRIYELVRAL